MCGCGHGYGIRIRIRQIESLHVAIRNASAHKTRDQFTGVMLIHGVSPQVSRGRALKHRGDQLIHNTWDSRPNSRSSCCGDIMW